MNQLAELIEAGTDVPIEPGVDLFPEGEHANFWWVLVEGAIDLHRYVGREDTVVGRMDVPGRWAGGFRVWRATRCSRPRTVSRPECTPTAPE